MVLMLIKIWHNNTNHQEFYHETGNSSTPAWLHAYSAQMCLELTTQHRWSTGKIKIRFKVPYVATRLDLLFVLGLTVYSMHIIAKIKL